MAKFPGGVTAVTTVVVCCCHCSGSGSIPRPGNFHVPCRHGQKKKKKNVKWYLGFHINPKIHYKPEETLLKHCFQLHPFFLWEEALSSIFQ